MGGGQLPECPSKSGIREVVAINGVGALVVACSKDATVYRNVVQDHGYEDKLQ